MYITSRYFDIVTGEREQGSETAKLWTELYPKDWKPYNGLANNAILLGRYDSAVDYARQAVELGPTQDFGSSNLIAALIAVNRLMKRNQGVNNFWHRGTTIALSISIF